MMRPDSRKLLFDVIAAAEAIREFTQACSLQDYMAGRMRRSACERQFEIIGEAMSRLRDQHPDVFQDFAEARSIIAFRNRLIHGYDTVDDETVWDVITMKLPELERAVRARLDRLQ